jgi:hypothetical protein
MNWQRQSPLAQLSDLAEIFRESFSRCFAALDAGGSVKAINAKAFASLTIGRATS